MSTCILENDWASKVVPCLLTIIVLMGTYIWWLIKERKEPETRDPERKEPGVCTPEQNRHLKPKENNEVESTKGSAKVPDLLVIAEYGECFHKPTCSYVKTARGKGKAKSRSRKLRPCTICFPMEQKVSEDTEVQNIEDHENLAETNIA